MRRTFLFVLTLLVLVGAVLAARAQGRFEAARLPGTAPVRYGLTLDADRAFYSVGDTLFARCTRSNWTQADAVFWYTSIGGNGCNFAIFVLDAQGHQVWAPSSGCLFGQRTYVLSSDSDRTLTVQIPLVYRNSSGAGNEGDPLPPGVYQLAVSIRHFGPARPSSGFGPGLTYQARIPFAIE